MERNDDVGVVHPIIIINSDPNSKCEDESNYNFESFIDKVERTF